VRERLDDWWEEQRFYIYIAGLLVILTLAVLWPRMFITVPAGHRGVLFRTLQGGSVVDRTWPEGLHLIPPWDRLTLYETRAMTSDLEFSLLTKDGLELQINISVRYRPVVEMLGTLHQNVGPDYFKRVVSPDIESDLRRTVGDRTAYELYSTEGDILQSARASALEQLGKQNIELQELLLKKIVLPSIVREAIEEKHRQEQKVHEYEFRLQTEDKEAARKRIEAVGIRDFENIVGTIAPDVLRWRGIDATLELARSNNAKIVVVGGDGRLPVLLDAPNPTTTERPRSADAAGAERPRAGEAATTDRSRSSATTDRSAADRSRGSDTADRSRTAASAEPATAP
jgi:regulator of protease activity HflC (stomatin/prohibitin superfamily)